MVVKSQRTVVVSKLELIAQLDSARWQLSRECSGLGDDLSQKLSVKAQLQQSIRRKPSAWGIATLAIGFLAARLLFRKKTVGNYKNASYRMPRSSVFAPFAPFVGPLLKIALLAKEPIIAKLLKQQVTSSSRKPNTPHVR